MVDSIKVKAICILVLLAGHEAARIQQGARITGAARKVMQNAVGPEDLEEVVSVNDEWREANWACRWSTWNGGCMGPENSTTACHWHPLPLDKPPPLSSESCRFTDKYMLTQDRNKYYQIQARLLASKAKKFGAECHDASMLNLYCSRRGKHMYRALAFMSKAQDPQFTESLTDEQKAADKAIFTDALEHMKVFAGEHQDAVMMLKDKMIARGNAGLNGVKEMITLLTKLLRPQNPQEREEALEAIESMTTDPVVLTDEEKTQQDEAVKKLEESEDDVRELLENELNVFDEDTAVPKDDAEQGPSTALIQNSMSVLNRSPTMEIIHGIAFILIVWLVVSAVIWAVTTALSILLGLVLVILVGCGAYHAGEGEGGGALVQNTFQCFGEFLMWPIKKGGEAIKWVWEEFAPNSFRD